MSYATVYSRARVGVQAPLVTIEVHISNGLPAFSIVGLPETSVRESRDRVRSAIINSQFQFPQSRITVNLAPADLPKEGGRFDLPIAIGILAATGQIPSTSLESIEFYGELGLNGALRAIIGEVPSALSCYQAKRCCVLPQENAITASIIENAQIYPAQSLLEVFHHLTGQAKLDLQTQPISTASDRLTAGSQPDLDLADVIGQDMAKRGLEVAAAGQHNLLFMGPPGTGKSMLAQRLSSILPEMTDTEALETAAIYSISGKKTLNSHWRTRPFRSPHHTASGVALVGGGGVPKPGGISLAHNGILFLDELPEFDRKVLDVLREPMETGEVCISRASQQAEFPARFQLIAALNPSPTGHHTDGRSTSDQVLRYLNRISGPLLDRIDLQIDVPALPKGALSESNHSQAEPQNTTETSAQVRARGLKARAIMLNRSGTVNALLNNKQIKQHCALTKADQIFLEDTIHRLKMSIRAYHKIIKVARTLADLQGETNISRQHLSEALGYRAMDRLLAHLSM